MHTPLQTGKAASPTARRRVLIVDDHNFFAACLRALLDNESDLVVCDITTTSFELRERVERLRPDLLVIDLSLGTESGLEVGLRLRALEIKTPILFVSTMRTLSAPQLAAVSRAGFIPKSKSPAEFLTALRAILAPTEEAALKDMAEFAFARAAAKA